jgi:hypothetical protein
MRLYANRLRDGRFRPVSKPVKEPQKRSKKTGARETSPTHINEEEPRQKPNLTGNADRTQLFGFLAKRAPATKRRSIPKKH